MKTTDFFDLKIAELTSEESQKPDELRNIDLIEVEGEHFDLGFVRPRKISWRLNIENIDDLYGLIKSSKLGDNIAKWSKELMQSELEIKSVENLTKEEFGQWLSIYSAKIAEKQRGNTKVDQAWFDKKGVGDGKIGAILVYYNGKLIGGNIFTHGEKFIVGYGIVERPDGVNWNLGALVDFECIKKAKELGYKVISFGKDTNLYGFHLSSGLFSYKARLGLNPEPIEKEGWVTTKFLSFDKFNFPVVFLAKDEGDKNYIQVLYKEEKPNPQEFETTNITDVRLLKVE